MYSAVETGLPILFLKPIYWYFFQILITSGISQNNGSNFRLSDNTVNHPLLFDEDNASWDVFCPFFSSSLLLLWGIKSIWCQSQQDAFQETGKGFGQFLSPWTTPPHILIHHLLLNTMDMQIKLYWGVWPNMQINYVKENYAWAKLQVLTRQACSTKWHAPSTHAGTCILILVTICIPRNFHSCSHLSCVTLCVQYTCIYVVVCLQISVKDLMLLMKRTISEFPVDTILWYYKLQCSF